MNTQLVYLAVIQQGQIVLIKNAFGKLTLPFYYQLKSDPWDLPAINLSWELFGWRPDRIKRPPLPKTCKFEIETLCAVCQFEADHKSNGAIEEEFITRAWPRLIDGQLDGYEPIINIILSELINKDNFLDEFLGG